MDKQNSAREFQSLLHAIKTSEVAETRVELIPKLRTAVPSVENSDFDALLEFLITLWEDFTCLDVSQCLLNKAIIGVAAKYLEGDCFRCQGEFLTLGTKASEWCAKHLKMTLMSNDDSQDEEHYNIYFQLLLDCLNFSVACFSLVTRSSTLGSKVLRDTLEKFILNQLTLIKDLVSEFKKIQALTSDLLKGIELVLDSALRLCKVYSQTVNWELCNQITDKDSSAPENDGEANLNHVTKIVKYTIEKLSDIGTLAADSGGSLVSILNLSWKGVVSLLQLGEGTLAGKINIGEIILILISLATDSMKCAAETWWSTLDQAISVTEAKRAFLPIKFYLINAVRIISHYPRQAFSVYQEISLCILLLTTLRIIFSREASLKNVCEAMEEHLKPTSLHLLKSLLNSTQLVDNEKIKILDWLFVVNGGPPSSHSDNDTDVQKDILHDVLSVSCETIAPRSLLIGRVALFIDLVKVSPDLDQNLIFEISRKLKWCLDVFVDEEVYASALVVQVPASPSGGDGKSLVLTWESFLLSAIHSLKLFMVIVLRTQLWSEMEFFLLDNFFHPHFLCREIIMDLWCFLVRHVEDTTVNAIIDELCSLYKMMASSESSDSLLDCHSSLREMARSMCLLLGSCTPYTVDRVYKFIMSDDRSHLSAIMFSALLMEGFQLNLLSDDLREAAIKRILVSYVQFVDDYIDTQLNSCSSDTLGLPVVALCSALQSMQIDASGIIKKTMKFLLVVAQTYKKSVDRITKNNCCRLLSEALGIISAAKLIYADDELEDIIIELENMFISGTTAEKSALQKCKPALASFMSSLGHMKMEETEENVKTSAVWQLYHMLLKDQNWALIHLVISAFGYFAARTSCSQLWRFVPSEAALSYDPETGTEADGERFMLELKEFLEKEAALPDATASTTEQLKLVFKEGLILRDLFEKNLELTTDAPVCENLKASHVNVSNKRRKLPDGFIQGIELLQNGLKIMGDGLSSWQKDQLGYAEVDDSILTQFSRLEDMVNHLARLADTG